MRKEFLGYHSEWNLGSPGGWDYQRMAQITGKLSWKKIRDASGIKIDLDFDDPMLNPVPSFAQTLLRNHNMRYGTASASIALVAERETLEKVGENIHFVDYLNGLDGVTAFLTSPERLEEKNGDIFFEEHKITTIFADFNNNVIVKLRKKHDLSAFLTAIRKGLVVNPRGMEPVGNKGVFEAVTDAYRDSMSPTTVKRTPWTRLFFSRATVGPNGEEIPDLIEWVKKNWEYTILKPVDGHSGKGIIIGRNEPRKDEAIQRAITAGNYIVQPLVPTNLWAEEFPWFDRTEKKLSLKRWQTDFRCFITDAGPIGFVTRFGGIPTNVGSGGGVQSTAVLKSPIEVSEAIKKINEAILALGDSFAEELQRVIDKESIRMGNVYLLGPLMSTLRPRIITRDHITQIRAYAENLWNDAITLESLWKSGKLDRYASISDEEREIARLAPWQGKPALIASDGLFGFGGEID